MGNSHSLSTSVITPGRKAKLNTNLDADDSSGPTCRNGGKRYGGFKKSKAKKAPCDQSIMQLDVGHRRPADYSCLQPDEMIPDREKHSPPLFPADSHADSVGLVAPRKPPNPAKEVPELRELHRELAFNNKMGINVLGQKSELKKAMEKMQGQMCRKQLDEEKRSQRSDLERELEKRATRLKEYENLMTEPTSTFPPSENEFHRIHAKVNGRFASATS